MVFDLKTTCSFTGHRIIPQKDYFALEEKTENAVKALIERGFKTFITGGALGFDTLSAQCVLRLRKEHSIKLAVAVPCRDQSRGWNTFDKELYEKILAYADEVITLSETYTQGCMHKRNRFMVDNSGALVAYLTKMRGGAFYTVNYAKNNNKEIIFVR